MKTYGKKKTLNSEGHRDDCIICHPPGKNLKKRARRQGKQICKEPPQ